METIKITLLFILLLHFGVFSYEHLYRDHSSTWGHMFLTDNWYEVPAFFLQDKLDKSVYGSSVCSDLGFLATDFTSCFKTDEEFKQLNIVSLKYKLGHLFFGLPGLALSIVGFAEITSEESEWDTKTNLYLIASGISLLSIDFTLSRSAWNNLAKAVTLRNKRLGYKIKNK